MLFEMWLGVFLRTLTLMLALTSTVSLRSVIFPVTTLSKSVIPNSFFRGLNGHNSNVKASEKRINLTIFPAVSATSSTSQESNMDNCECNSIMYSGRPSRKAQSINPRTALVGSTIYRVSGEAVAIDEILPGDDTTVAIVVFLRSFGCPFCQELLLKYSREVEMLVDSNIKLIVIGIGKPSVGQELITHLQIPNGDQFVFADPENTLYDRLDLNRGVPSTFFSIATPLALGDRFLKGDTKDLGEVLEKWKNAAYVPPKRGQAFNQGGTFVFRGENTIYAHYDEATSAHADMATVIERAKEASTTS